MMTICTCGMEAWTVSGECAGCSHMNKRNQQMTKAPERIWAEPGMPGYLDEVSPTYTVGYIRADIHAELMKAAYELAEAVCVLMAQCEDGDGYTERSAIDVDCAIARYHKAKEKTNAV